MHIVSPTYTMMTKIYSGKQDLDSRWSMVRDECEKMVVVLIDLHLLFRGGQGRSRDPLLSQSVPLSVPAVWMTG